MGKKRKNDQLSIKNTAPQGRPKKQKRKQEQSTIEHWFQNTICVKIVIFLGKEGQILFKSLSGHGAAEKKTEISNNGIIFDNFKKDRQEFLSYLSGQQQLILNSLQLPQDIKYMLIGNNPTNKFNFQDNQEYLNLLAEIIHPNFSQSFIALFDPTISNETLSDFNQHRHLVSWALITSISKEPKLYLQQLQQTQENQELENKNQKDYNTIKEDYSKFAQLPLNCLLCEFQEPIKRQIEKLREELLQIIQQM